MKASHVSWKYFSTSFQNISLHSKNFIIPDTKVDMHGIFGKNKSTQNILQTCLDLKKRDCATSLLESIGWSYLQRRILTFTSPGPPGYSIFCWKASTAMHNQSRRFLKCNDNNFLTQVITEPTRGLAAPHTCKPERACLACEGWEQLWPQWSQDAGVQDPEGWKQHK